MKTIVISAVNLRKGGTLTILRQCLEYLSLLGSNPEYRIIAIVHKKELADYPNIEYIEKPNIIKGWCRRLWCEYVTMYKISKKIQPINLWLSLHDTTPRVIAEKRAVYCQTSFPFLDLRLSDLKYNYKTVLFSLFTKYAYRINIKKNNILIVQANWLRESFSKMFNFPENKIIVFPPKTKILVSKNIRSNNDVYTFIYAATPDCHKNFEYLCRAAQMLETELKDNSFRVIITISGEECSYSKFLWEKFGRKVKALDFIGYVNQNELYSLYQEADCLIFPSRVETWGLPISEFSNTEKPMLLADLPYAHETSLGCRNVAFFDIKDYTILKGQMKRLMEGDYSFLNDQKKNIIKEPACYSWDDLFKKLI